MEGEKRFPLAYRLVAGLFLLNGVSWLMSAMVDFFPPIAIIMGIVFLVTGIGLFGRVHALWTVALFLVWLEIAGLCILLVIDGIGLLAAMQLIVLAIYVVIFAVKLALSIWAYRVLIRQDVCAVYYQ